MKVGLFFGSFAGGGAEKMMINLAKGFKNHNFDVTIFVFSKSGPHQKLVPKDIEIFNLEAKFGAKSVIHKVRKILSSANLDVIISTQAHINGVVGLSSIGLENRPLLIFREANMPSYTEGSILRKAVYKYTYRFADAYTAVSEGVKKDLAEFYNIPLKTIDVVYNPVVDDALHDLKYENVNHPWFQSHAEPVIVGMGRIVPQKGFEDLIDAFSYIREVFEARLVIFGSTTNDPEYYTTLIEKVETLNLAEFVEFPGFVDNPYKYLRNAAVFVLSSKYEGLPGVLIQALACGCPVVSTDCPSGPKEILENGKFGKLVPVGAQDELGEAIGKVLRENSNEKMLVQKSLDFHIDKSVKDYINIINELL